MAWFMDTYSVYQGYTVPEIVTGKPVASGGTARPARSHRARRRLSHRARAQCAQDAAGQMHRRHPGLWQCRRRRRARPRLKTALKVIGVSDHSGALHDPRRASTSAPLSGTSRSTAASPASPRADFDPERTADPAMRRPRARRDGARHHAQRRRKASAAASSPKAPTARPRPPPTASSSSAGTKSSSSPTSSATPAASSSATSSGCRTCSSSSGTKTEVTRRFRILEQAFDHMVNAPTRTRSRTAWRRWPSASSASSPPRRRAACSRDHRPRSRRRSHRRYQRGLGRLPDLVCARAGLAEQRRGRRSRPVHARQHDAGIDGAERRGRQCGPDSQRAGRTGRGPRKHLLSNQ